jgi:hypothetical protein
MRQTLPWLVFAVAVCSMNLSAFADVVAELKKQIDAKQIIFDQGSEDKLRKELLGENEGTKITANLQNLVLELSKVKAIRISSIIRDEGHHGKGRAVDIGNEEIAEALLSEIATDPKVKALKIDEIIFDAGGDDLKARNRFNYDLGKKHPYDDKTLKDHRNHIHFAVTE